jgi:predicted metal-dependent hydrolase
MMSGTLSITLSTENSDLVFSAGGRRRRLVVRRFDHARSMRLSVDPRDGTVRLSLPPRASLSKALRWAEERRAWVEATLAELPKPIRIIPGVALPFNGGTLIVEWRKSLPRTPQRVGDRLRLGGPLESLSRRVLSWLRAEAGRVLIAETRALAKRHDITVNVVSVGDPRSRWGSCTASGNIRYSWRLIMAPPKVRRATVAHELAHRVHMNHGPRFHALVAKLHGADPDYARDWLREHGSALYWVGAPG